ncbi:hypothetical protein TELCIR_14617 [Teladorsagia circumcincta]|uniref:Uncharacterized protein n=1 Tax=Teladorsagia circumcincta TaxID=45464 RepID=A0A2G9U0L3_TELCI|nr:hypothetical protein TELCIR_14617 [Teladorsagia circumcincta]
MIILWKFTLSYAQLGTISRNIGCGVVLLTEGFPNIKMLFRFRLDSTDIAQDHDFLLFNDGFGILDELIESCWMIYTITERYVYFVRIPYESSLSISKTPRLTALCHSSADRVARMEISEFVRETKSKIPSSKGQSPSRGDSSQK